MFPEFKKSNLLAWAIDLILICLLVFTFGFDHFERYKPYAILALPLLLIILLGVNFYQFKSSKTTINRHKTARFNLYFLSLLLIAEVIVLFFNYENALLDAYIHSRYVLEYGFFFYFFIRLTLLVRRIFSAYFNPALLFVLSFALVALTGTFLLMLPAATTQGISFVDALFTATSATAVTGLIVLDTAKDFTTFGQTIILVLIQIGGLGMLTFTSFFAYFFKSGSTFSESLYMRDILGNEKLSNVMGIAMQIVLFSLVLEVIGALVIYHSLNDMEVFTDRSFSAIFHAISAFCNAGFSLASNNMMETGLQFNYYMQWAIMALIVLGGLGYGIASNFIQYLKKYIFNLFNQSNKYFISRIINLNTQIVMYTTLILIVLGTAFVLIAEQSTILAVHDTAFGKFTTALFTSITTRTAGFNTVDVSNLTVPGIFFIMLLMWIGASPASTGGGIKTTTFALAVLNVVATARGKKNIEIGTRRVPAEAVQKAFSIMLISLVAIGIGITLILIFDPALTLLEVAFEAFSAYSTVGLSLGITNELSTESKYVVVFLMFFGRIGIINLLIGLLKTMKTTQYTYPEESILIN